MRRLFHRLRLILLLAAGGVLCLMGMPLSLIPPHWPGIELLGIACILMLAAVLVGFRQSGTPHSSI